MNTNQLLEVLGDQKLELAAMLQEPFCDRKEEQLINLQSKKAQVVIGVRRSGKSTLCIQALRKANVNFAYINFDDERLASLKADNLNEALRCLYQIYGQFNHLFIDEIQNINEWFLFVNRLLRQGMHVVVSGSNAKLLSGELATHLTGRHNRIELHPFSFADFCNVRGVDITTQSTIHDALRRKAFGEYLNIGGFPEVVKGEEENESYIDQLTSNILQRDIIKRFRIRYKTAFETLANHMLNNVPQEVSHKSLQKLFNFSTDHTVENYLGYMQQAYLLLPLHKYSAKSKIRMRNMKCYAVDVALMNARKHAFAAENLGFRLETAVYVHLRRKYGPEHDIYYYSERSFEADFVVCHRNQALAVVQVSLDISKPETYRREINGLVKGAKATDATDLLLITAYDEDEIEVSGYKIRIIPCYKWMLEE